MRFLHGTFATFFGHLGAKFHEHARGPPCLSRGPPSGRQWLYLLKFVKTMQSGSCFKLVVNLSLSIRVRRCFWPRASLSAMAGPPRRAEGRAAQCATADREITQLSKRL